MLFDNYENRLTKITYPDGSTSQYFYDGVGKRVKSIENGEITYYLYDGLNVIIERDEFHTTTATHTRGLSYGGGIGSIISAARQLEDNHRGKRRGHKRWDEEFTTYYYHYDGIGTVTALTDDEGDVVQEYTYDAYGNILAVEDDEIINPYRGQIMGSSLEISVFIVHTFYCLAYSSIVNI
ncbi:hypothetical protein M1N54_01290 [Thermodesulfovibrionales bacterium]|nr:hypothetical protein [Thermodesulfovibrionales bacterium]